MLLNFTGLKNQSSLIRYNLEAVRKSALVLYGNVIHSSSLSVRIPLEASGTQSPDCALYLAIIALMFIITEV